MSFLASLINAALPALNGTMDVLTVPLLIPKHVVESLLPPSLRHASPPALLPIPASLREFCEAHSGNGGGGPAAAGAETHLVLLQLGSLTGAGPGPIPMWFQEAKLEIPFVRHPDFKDVNRPFLFKQKCLFSFAPISLASRYLTGLESSTATFRPARSPLSYAPDAPTIEYEVKGFVKVGGDAMPKDERESERAQAGVEEVGKLSSMTWFGFKTENVVTEFDFSPPTIAPKPYTLDVQLNLGAFSQDADAHSGQETFRAQNVLGFRTKSFFRARTRKLRQLE